VRVVPPASRIGALLPAERSALVAASPLGVRYAKLIDRESAYEILKGKMNGASRPAEGVRAGSSAREPSIEEIEAELRGIPLPGRAENEEPHFAGEPAPRIAAGQTTRAPESRAVANRAGAASRPAVRRSPAQATETVGGFAAELARVALSAAGRELGRQAVRGILGTRRRGR